MLICVAVTHLAGISWNTSWKNMTKPKSLWDIWLLKYLSVKCFCNTAPHGSGIAFFWRHVKEELMKSKEMLVFYIVWFSLCFISFPCF